MIHAHLEANHLTLQLDELDISPNYVDAFLKKLAFSIDENIAIKSFSGQFHLDSTHLNLTEQHLETNHTKLDFSLLTSFSSLSDFLECTRKSIDK